MVARRAPSHAASPRKPTRVSGGGVDGQETSGGRLQVEVPASPRAGTAHAYHSLSHAVVKVHETERDMHKLHTLKTVSSGSTPGVNRQKREKPKKIRCKCTTVARYSIPYRFLCNAATRRRYMMQTHHSCALSGRKPPQEPFAGTSTPSPSKMERGPGGKKDTGYLYKGPRQTCSQSHEGPPKKRGRVSPYHTPDIPDFESKLAQL